MKSPEVTKAIFTDPRDGKVYKTAKIGTQTWFAENLNYEAEGSVCYKNNPKYGAKYGRNLAVVVNDKSEDIITTYWTKTERSK